MRNSDEGGDKERSTNMIEIIAGILLLIWISGLLLHIAGGFIHIVLVIAIVVFMLRFLKKAV